MNGTGQGVVYGKHLKWKSIMVVIELWAVLVPVVWRICSKEDMKATGASSAVLWWELNVPFHRSNFFIVQC
jgi:hypothetical protein